MRSLRLPAIRAMKAQAAPRLRIMFAKRVPALWAAGHLPFTPASVYVPLDLNSGLIVYKKTPEHQ